jgi:hypothetical protein
MFTRKLTFRRSQSFRAFCDAVSFFLPMSEKKSLFFRWPNQPSAKKGPTIAKAKGRVKEPRMEKEASVPSTQCDAATSPKQEESKKH